MDRRTFIKAVPAMAVLSGAVPSMAEELTPIALPHPEVEGGKSVLAALLARRTNREISDAIAGTHLMTVLRSMPSAFPLEPWGSASR